MWKPILDANKGLTTQKGSIFDDLGLKVNISIINDATDSSNALIKGSLDAAGYTTNRLAFLSGKFDEANFDVVVPVYTNYSNGGDGIIATSDIKSVEDLVGAKIGVPEHSEAHTLVAWFVDNSDMSESDKDAIMGNLIMFDTPDDAAKAFFSGKIDVAATWQPYLSQAEEMTNGHILFDTSSSSKLIMDGIVFNREFAESNPELVTKFIDGVFQASDLYTTEFDYIREAMPMFAAESDESIKSSAADADLAGYKQNLEILDVDAPIVYQDMCEIWEELGESVNSANVSKLFDSSYVKALADKYSTIETSVDRVELSDEQKLTLQDSQALLKKSTTINFVADTAKFLDSSEAASALNDFVKIAKVLDGAIIQIEGNINASIDTPEGRQLSEERAKTVAKYFIANGIDPNRIIVVGNGNTKMVGDINTPEGAAKNRRTDVSFKVIEQ